MTLKKSTIAYMLDKGRGENQNLTIECRNLSKHHQQYIVFQIFEGQQRCKGVIEIERARRILDPFVDKNRNCRLLVEQYQVHNVKKKQGIMKVIEFRSFKVVQESSVKNQFHYHQNLLKVEEISKGVTKQPFRALMKTQSVKLQATERSSQVKANNNITYIPRSTLKFDFSSENEQMLLAPSKDADIKNFQKIEDLYDGLFGWELLARVIEKSFRQFISKQNREVTILTLEFIDKLGFTIQATCFGQQAIYLNHQMKIGGVYSISRGKICEETFSHHTSEKRSKYVIKILRDTSIVPMRDFPQIPYNSSNFVRLAQITEDLSTNQSFNFVGIITKVEEERTITKQDKQLTLQAFKIGDPLTNIVIECVIWNKQIHLQSDMVNKSVILKHFKINRYKDTVNLCATFKSEIAIHDFFAAYEDVWKPQPVKKTQNNVKTLAQLSSELKNIEKETIISDLTIWTNSISLGSKFYYDSCPRCKKTAIAFNRCDHCSYPIQQCKKRFLLTVELSDYTGSIYITAFEDTACIFLKNTTVQQLLAMDQWQRIRFGDKFTYQNYSLKISSKKDSNGRIYHHVIGKPELLDVKTQAQINLEIIQKELRNEHHILGGFYA